MRDIHHTVGRNGVNNFHDVLLVQKLLNLKGANLRVDGRCGPETRKAILDFQKHYYLNPDGVITPGTKVLEKLYQAGRAPGRSIFNSLTSILPSLDKSTMLQKAGNVLSALLEGHALGK